MEVIEVLGYVGAVIIGITLGLIGGGGSILTVPILVYLMGVSPVLATAYSLFIVGFSALIGGISYAKKGLVDFKTAVVFAIPAFLAVYFTRLLIIPALPAEIFSIGDFTLTKDTALLLIFAVLMVAASFAMIRGRKDTGAVDTNATPHFNFPMIILEGAVVGVLTGLVGAGGGFLIIPALVLFAKLPMKRAVGTSLFIIAAKSLIGFIGDIQANEAIDWRFLGAFTALAVVGIFGGSYMSKFIDGSKLKKGFGWFVLLMGTVMILKETGVLSFWR